jgi:hypothetical protein
MLVEGFGGCLPAEGFAGPVVEGESNGLDLIGLPSREVGALGEVLTKESVRVLVGAALPGAVRVGEVDLQPVADNGTIAPASAPYVVPSCVHR